MRTDHDVAGRLERLRRLAQMDGWVVVSLAGLGTVMALVGGYWVEAVFCLVVMTAGIMELRVAGALGGGAERRHFLLLAGCQALLALVVIAYALWRLATLKPEDLMHVVESSPLLRNMLTALGDEHLVESAFSLSLRLTYGLLIPLTLVFQGGMAIHYLRSGRRILAGLTPPPLPGDSEP